MKRASIAAGIGAAVAIGAAVVFAPKTTSPPVIPDPALTPGATLPVTAVDVCKPGYANGHNGVGGVRDVPQSEKDAVYKEYGIMSHAPGEFEVDHVISLECGGSNDIKNLFPERYSLSVDGLEEGAHEKDRLEDRLHVELCAGRITLPQAQTMLRGDWRPAYLHYFGAFPKFVP